MTLAYVEGVEIRALCGYTFTPSRKPDALPTECIFRNGRDEHWELPTGGGGMGSRPPARLGQAVLVTSTFRGHVAEVELGEDEGLDHDCAVNCDNVFTLPQHVLVRRRGRLGPEKALQFDRALSVTLGLA